MASKTIVKQVVSWGSNNYDKIMTAIGEGTLGVMIWDELFGEEKTPEQSNIVIDSDTKKLLEDIIVTNKANLILRNVRQDLYEPLNIDAQ